MASAVQLRGSMYSYTADMEVLQITRALKSQKASSRYLPCCFVVVIFSCCARQDSAVWVFTPRKHTSFFTFSIYSVSDASSSILLSKPSIRSVWYSYVIRYSLSVSLSGSLSYGILGLNRMRISSVSSFLNPVYGHPACAGIL